MRFLKALRGTRGQSISEYMLVLSVVAIGAMAGWLSFVNPNGPVQTAAEDLATNYANGLTNADGSTMKVGQ